MRQVDLNRIKKLELRLKPLAPSVRPAPIQIFRMSLDNPPRFQPENGGAWIDEQTMLAQCPATGSKVPSVVLVVGDWRLAADERTHEALLRGIKPAIPASREVTLTKQSVIQPRPVEDFSVGISGE